MQSPDEATRYWWIPSLLGIIVVATTLWLFERVYASIFDLGAYGVTVPLPVGDSEISRFLLRDASARFLWVGAEIVLVSGLALGVLVTAFYSIRALSSGSRRSVPRIGVLLLMALALLLVALFADFDSKVTPEKWGIIVSFDAIFEQVEEIERSILDCPRKSMTDEECKDLPAERSSSEPLAAHTGRWLVRELTGLSNVLSFLLIFVLILSFSCVLSEPRDDLDRFEHLRSQQQRIRELLYIGAALMIIGVIEIYLLLRWQGIHLAPGDAALGDQLARSIAAAFGSFFSILLVAVYIPSALLVAAATRHAVREDLLVRKEAISPAVIAKELESHGFASSSLEQLGRVAAVLGPVATAFIGGPLGQMLGMG